MDRNTVRKRLRGLRYGLVVGRTVNLRLPRSILIGPHRLPIRLPDEEGVRLAFLEILLSDVYGLKRLGRNAFSTVLDIGANVGLFTIAARKEHRRARIHAYEPNVALEPFLANQTKVANATWFREAVGGAAGRGRLDIDPNESVVTRLVPDESGSTQVVTLRTAVERLGKVDFAKVDCEGCEWAILDDAEPWESIDEVAVECHSNGVLGMDDAVRRLRDLGFAPIRDPDPATGVILASRVGLRRPSPPSAG
jgi:FkbM family methyltransferase